MTGTDNEMSNEKRSARIRELPTGERGRFERDPLLSPTLPSRYYTDEAIAARELTHVFQRCWTWVGHVSDVREAGDYFTDDIAGQPIVVVRGADGVVRAFFNVCQHRGHLLLEGRGKLGKGIVCPYHAWFYGLDGELLKARLTDDVAGFDRAEFRLKELPIAFAAGLVFVNLDRGCEPFDTDMAGFGPSMARHLPEVEGFHAAFRLHYDIGANWKVVVDNFSEAYHIPIAHPQLAKVLDRGMDEFQEEYRWSYILYRSRAGFEGLELEPGTPYLAWQAWPHLCMLSLPGSTNLIVLRMAPNGVGRCAERVDVYAPPGEPAPNLVAVKNLFMDMFNVEDIAIVESVQRGLSSLGFDQGRYVCDAAESWLSETLLHGFHKQVLEALEADQESSE